MENALGSFAGGITSGAAGAAGGGPRTSHISSTVQVTIQAGPGTSGMREAVREGATAGLGDLNAELTALESIG